MSSSDSEKHLSSPGPGSWQLDATHYDRPITRYARDLIPAAFAEGQSRWMRDYGMPMKTVACELVDGFVYIQPIPLKGKPGGKPPPALLFKLIFHLVPSMRRCRRLAERAFRDRRWRADARRWSEEIWPRLSSKFRALQQVELRGLGDDELLAHLGEATAVLEESLVEHLATNGPVMIPVGMFIAEVMSWADLAPEEVIDAIGTGTIRDQGMGLLDNLAGALERSGGLNGAGDLAPADLLAALRARDDEVGEAARAWLDHVGVRQIWAGDLHLPMAEEVPQLLVEQLRSHRPHAAAVDRPDPAAALRARIPANRRQRFDELLAEARSSAFIRDQRSSQNDAWAGGLVRRALLEVGRRLAERDLVDDPSQVVHLEPAEIETLVTRGDGPDRATIRRHAADHQRSSDCMPAFIGSEPAPPPSFDAVGGALADMARGIFAYVDLMEDLDPPASGQGDRLQGFAASPGDYTGVARVVRGPEDFVRVKRGDVLVARATMPSYNGALAVAGAVVTDRGGALSHAAIVARELGIPAVVGTMRATQQIPDGARVRVDGTGGVVELLR